MQKGMSALPPKADIHVCSVRPLKHFLNVAVRTTGRQLRSKTDSQVASHGNLRCIGPANAQRIDRTLLD